MELVTPYYPSPRSVIIHGLLLTARELFMVGHELTRVTAGHLDKIRSVDSAVPDGFKPESVLSRRDEFDADALGLKRCLKACETREIDQVVADHEFVVVGQVEVACNYPQAVRIHPTLGEIPAGFRATE